MLWRRCQVICMHWPSNRRQPSHPQQPRNRRQRTRRHHHSRRRLLQHSRPHSRRHHRQHSRLRLRCHSRQPSRNPSYARTVTERASRTRHIGSESTGKSEKHNRPTFLFPDCSNGCMLRCVLQVRLQWPSILQPLRVSLPRTHYQSHRAGENLPTRAALPRLPCDHEQH